ncbi:MAG: hypothetical protein B7Z35_03075 [Hydrogenophilales bacterium 12-61-10]|nr:MAG: hypothetical protein B7Z35_03075 [Hydrogenophilales bacterium 12-61-10]
MTVSQVQRVTGYLFQESEDTLECGLVGIASHKMYSKSEMVALWFFVYEGRVVGAEVWDSATKTNRGVGYKDPESKVLAAHMGQIEKVANPSLDNYSELYIWSSDRSSAVRFRSNGNYIYVLQAGLAPYIARCM